MAVKKSETSVKEAKTVPNKKESMKIFDYSLLIDIMEKASKFDKVKLVIPDVVDFEIINTELVPEVKRETLNMLSKPQISNYQEIEETHNALDELRSKEELLMTDPDAYFEAAEKGEFR